MKIIGGKREKDSLMQSIMSKRFLECNGKRELFNSLDKCVNRIKELEIEFKKEDYCIRL